jgi:hypothetical protein
MKSSCEAIKRDPCGVTARIEFRRGASKLERRLPWSAAVVGRITEAHLDDAERTFPGICRLYRTMAVKPATFLQLVWHYETACARRRPRRPRRTAAGA